MQPCLQGWQKLLWGSILTFYFSLSLFFICNNKTNFERLKHCYIYTLGKTNSSDSLNVKSFALNSSLPKEAIVIVTWFLDKSYIFKNTVFVFYWRIKSRGVSVMGQIPFSFIFNIHISYICPFPGIPPILAYFPSYAGQWLLGSLGLFFLYIPFGKGYAFQKGSSYILFIIYNVLSTIQTFNEMLMKGIDENRLLV